MGRTILDPNKIYFHLVIFRIIQNPQIQVSMNLSIAAKPRNIVPMKLNDFTVTASMCNHLIFLVIFTNLRHTCHIPRFGWGIFDFQTFPAIKI